MPIQADGMAPERRACYGRRTSFDQPEEFFPALPSLVARPRVGCRAGAHRIAHSPPQAFGPAPSLGNFIHVAGNINASGGGSNPSAPYPQGPRLNEGTGELINGAKNFSGGGFFTGYWLTT